MNVRCQCGAGYKVKDEFAGRKLKCKSCQSVFIAKATSPPAPRLPDAQVAAPLQAPPPPPAIGNPYAGRRNPAAKTANAKSRVGGRKKLGSLVAIRTPGAKKIDKSLSKAEREEELLNDVSTGPSLRERIAERRRDSIESGRYSNGVFCILKGLGVILLGVVVAMLFWNFDNGGALPVILVPLYYIGAQYWAGPAIGLFGLYLIVIGIGSFFKLVDIDTEQQLPDSF